LPVPGFAVDQHRAVHRRHQFERREQRLHRAVPADDVLESELAFELRFELGVLFSQPLLLEAGVQYPGELRQLEWLDQKVHRPALDRRDRFCHSAEPGHDHGANLRIATQRFVQHRHAVGIGQPQVDDQAVVGERP
jgi:hypothetical protein